MSAPERPLRIAMVGLRGIDEHISGGVERHVRELAVRMAGRGHTVTVFCRAGYQPADGTPHPGVRVKIRPAIRSKHLEAISHTLAVMPEVMLPQALGGYDLVHIHAVGPALFAWLPRLSGRKVVVTLHGLDFLRARWGRFASCVLRLGAWSARCFAHELIVVSHTLQEYCRAHGRADAHWLPNGVNAPPGPLRETGPDAVPCAEANDVLARHGLAPGGYLLSLGRLVAEKGLHHLIRAFRGLDTPLALVIAGEGAPGDGYAEDLRDAARGDARITFTGALYGADKDVILRNARLFVLPSELEGMPITLLEAMSHGCPALTADIAECDEIRTQAAAEGVDELFAVFACGDARSLHDALERLLTRPDLAATGLRARQYVLARYDWEAVTDATLRIYARAVQGQGGVCW